MWNFHKTEAKCQFEARYWRSNGFPVAIVASVTKGFDWAAYIGGSPSKATELQTCVGVAEFGAKLTEEDARYFFPDLVELPYRY